MLAHLTPLARTSIILSWLLVGLACITTIIQIAWLSCVRKVRPHVADLCVWIALILGIALVAQTTWAVVDEGSGKHQLDMRKRNIAAVAKVIIAHAIEESVR